MKKEKGGSNNAIIMWFIVSMLWMGLYFYTSIQLKKTRKDYREFMEYVHKEISEIDSLVRVANSAATKYVKHNGKYVYHNGKIVITK